VNYERREERKKERKKERGNGNEKRKIGWEKESSS
jgi:hypothetical protein